MKPISWRVQLGCVAASFVAALGAAGFLLFERHLQYVNHPQDVMASGGMYAGGDLLLELFIGVLLLIPTVFLGLVIRRSETLYTRYGKVMLGLSLSAPICLALLTVPAVNQSPMLLGELCLFRLVNMPFVLIGLAVVRLLARFERSKRLTTYALLIKAMTFVVAVGLLVLSARSRGSG